MSYEAKSIHEVVTDIEAGKFYLPALQRKFVWNESRITLLFDSVLRGYPISTFLFWFLKKQKANDYVFYKFLDRYDEREPYNKRRDGHFTQDEIIGVLDGQQRLSSIYIGLQGKYITKKKYKRSNNPDAYPERELYINLLNTPYQLDSSGDYPRVVIDESKNFEFRFLTKSQSAGKAVGGKKERRDECWLKVGELIKWNEDTSPSDVYESIYTRETDEEVTVRLSEQKRFIVKTLENLRDKFIKERIVTYFKTSKEELESILNIFVRVNSGAVSLSKSDLLFSTIIATWENGREEIERLQKELNSTGDGFGFSNDFLMRSLLVLSDLPIAYKVNSFTSENVQKIKVNWEQIRKALIDTINVLKEAGLSKELVPSQNAVIPIAYYICHGGILSPECKDELIKYLKHAFLKNVFGSQGDNVLNAMRNALRHRNEDGSYRLDRPDFFFRIFIKRLKLSGDKNLLITDEDLEEFLETKKGQTSFLLLSTIYPHFKYGQVALHQDHIHPHSAFKNTFFRNENINDEQKKEWLEKRDMLPNLQLLEGGENKSKNATPFKAWLLKKFPQNSNKEAFLERNHIAPEVSLELIDFEPFFEERKKLLKEALIGALETRMNP